MPADRGVGGPHWDPRPDFVRRGEQLTHRDPELTSPERLAHFLMDACTLPEAEAYRHLDQPALIEDMYREEAKDLWFDVKYGFTPDEAMELRARRLAGHGVGMLGFMVAEDGTRHTFSTEPQQIDAATEIEYTELKLPKTATAERLDNVA